METEADGRDYGSVTIPVDFVTTNGGEMGVRLMDVTGDGVLDLAQAVCDDTTLKGIYTERRRLFGHNKLSGYLDEHHLRYRRGNGGKVSDHATL